MRLFSTNMVISETKGQGSGQAHLNYYASAYNRGDNYHTAR